MIVARVAGALHTTVVIAPAITTTVALLGFSMIIVSTNVRTSSTSWARPVRIVARAPTATPSVP